NGSEHLPGIDFFNGDSRARWEGDTLIVDVADFNDDPQHPTWFDSSGNYHSDALHVVERWTRTGPDTMVYRATMEDRKVFSRPWTIEVLLYRHQENLDRPRPREDLAIFHCSPVDHCVRACACPAFD